MKNKFRIGITDDTNIIRCRLIVKLVEICGGVPVLIPTNLNKDIKRDKHIKDEQFESLLENHLKIVDSVLESCNALIFPGNKRDVHPNLYGEDYIHPQTKRRLSVSPFNARQATEVRMIEYALKRKDIPVLGICGGMHLINAVLGGNLVQHLPDDSRTDNSQRENYHYDENLKNLTNKDIKNFENNFELILQGKKENIYTGTHPMKVFEDSLLAKIYKDKNPNININNISELSIHHQGCFEENLSDQFRISAIAPDGVIEAVEHKNYPKMFLLTQFHPECDVSGIAIKLVEELIKSI
ncbi:gamma-glutamyl-gamma-aminobutyrate hydrolase family protein [Flavobacteriaceae bacterium]|nr:gamma-glutamyl-gamma-aminobutyrate hydrolase family protein [Flavobacteriaceae bacterium]